MKETKNEKLYRESYNRLGKAVEDFLENHTNTTCQNLEYLYEGITSLDSVYKNIDNEVMEKYAANFEPANEEIYRTGYMKLLAVFNDFTRESMRMESVADIHGAILRLEHVVKKVDQEGADAFNFGDRKDAADELVQEMQYTNVTLQDKYNALIDLMDRWLVTDYKDKVLNEHEYDERVAQSRAIQDLPCNMQPEVNEDAEIKYMKVNAILSPEQLHNLQTKYQYELGPTYKVILLDNTVDIMDNIKAEQSGEAFLTITLEDINAVPQVWLEGKEVKNKQAVRFEYQTDGDNKPIPNYIFVQSLLSGGDKKAANIMTQEYNKPLGVSPLSSIDLDYNVRGDWERGVDNTMKLMQDAYNSGRVNVKDNWLANKPNRYTRGVLDTNTGDIRTEGSDKPYSTSGDRDKLR